MRFSYQLFLILLFVIGLIVGLNIDFPVSSSSKTLKSSQQTAKDAYKDCINYQRKNFITKDACYSKIFYKLTQEKGSDFAFETVAELKIIDRDVLLSCHPIGHSIGWGVYDLNPEKWRENIRKMTKECNYGAQMGMIEKFAKVNGGELDKKIVPTICDSSGGCNHGIGHIALVVMDDDIDKALDLCSPLPNVREERHWCYTGVFMERMTMQNLAEHRQIEPEKLRNWYKSLESFADFCNTFKGEVYTACWAELSQPATFLYKGEPAPIFDFCARGKTTDAIKKCQRDSVATIIEMQHYNLSDYKYICDYPRTGDTEFIKECYGKMAYASALNLPSDKLPEVVSFCSSLDETYKPYCYSMLYHAQRSVREGVMDIGKVCSAAEPEYKNVCLYGES